MKQRGNDQVSVFALRRLVHERCHFQEVSCEISKTVSMRKRWPICAAPCTALLVSARTALRSANAQGDIPANVARSLTGDA